MFLESLHLWIWSKKEKWKSPTIVNEVLWESADFIGIWTLWSWWITLVINLCAYFSFKTLINCYVGWQDFAILKPRVWKSTENLISFWYNNQRQSNNELEAWQEFEVQLRLIHLPVSYVCSVSKWRRCRRLKALCIKKKDKTTQMPRSMNRIPAMRGFRTKTCLPITMILSFPQNLTKPIQSNPRQSIAAAAAAAAVILTWTLIPLKIV